MLARAALLHDENNYRQELEKSAEFAPRRQQALAEFQKAARLYVAAAPGLPQDEQNTQVFEYWFYAGLGACDLQHITEETLADNRQPPLIRQALESLKGEERRAAHGQVRQRPLHPAQWRQAVDQVQVSEGGLRHRRRPSPGPRRPQGVRLLQGPGHRDQARDQVDGSDVVGHEKPFGVFVNLRHTREIERESGGFGRYLQNQNNQGYYYYNFGRPLENYRDKFQEIVKQALQEQFEVVSVTFQDEKVNSRATSEYGWRVTPYAYLLLKARGPKVDKIPPVRLDLDFMDTSGYVILPVESPTIPIDAAPAKGEARPFEKLQVTQTLDERQAKDGKLILEVKATARGLVPELDSILDVQAPGFEIDKTDDQGAVGLAVRPRQRGEPGRLGANLAGPFPGAPVETEDPKTFKFASAKVDGAEMIYQRYVDADLAKVGPEVALEARYGEPSHACAWWLGGGLLAARAGHRRGDRPGPLASQTPEGREVRDARGGHAVLGPRPAPRDRAKERVVRPAASGAEHVDPATRAALLRRLQRRRARPENDRRELDRPRVVNRECEAIDEFAM